MRLNKIIVGASAFAMAAALSAGVGSADASADKVEGSVSDKISIDYKNQTLKLAELDDTKISVAFPTVKDKKVGADKNLCTYDVDSKKVDVDLSTLNVTKDNYIKVWGNKNKVPVIVKIPAATQLGKGTVKDNKITVVDKAKAEVKVALDYAIGNGEFNPQAADTGDKATAIDVANYTQLGATVRVRTSASEELTNVKLLELTAQEYAVGKSTTEKVSVYEATGTFAGKEAKVKVPKMANAPKIKVDWTKGTVTLPKGAEYRVNTIGDSAALGDGFNPGDKLVLTAVGTSVDVNKGTVLDFEKGGDIDVRTAKTDKKPASKYLSFVYGAKATYYVDGNSPAAPSPDGKKVDDSVYDAVSSSVKDKDSDGKEVVAISYARTKGAGKTATSGAITISNKDANGDYQYLLLSGDSITAPTADAKGVKTIKAKAGDVTLKLKNKNAQKLYVRKAAVTKGNSLAWATDWVEVMSLTKTDMVPSFTKTAK
jgi:hypothetical protein